MAVGLDVGCLAVGLSGSGVSCAVAWESAGFCGGTMQEGELLVDHIRKRNGKCVGCVLRDSFSVGSRAVWWWGRVERAQACVFRANPCLKSGARAAVEAGLGRTCIAFFSTGEVFF